MHHISVSGHNEQIKHELSGRPEYNINFGQTESRNGPGGRPFWANASIHKWKDTQLRYTSTMPKSERDETHMSVLVSLDCILSPPMKLMCRRLPSLS